MVGSLAVAIAPAHAVEPPTGLRVTGSGFNAIAIAWDPVPGAFGYRVDYATNPTFSGLVKETTRSTARVLKNGAKGLLPATMYYFRVMVIDANLTPVSPPSPTTMLPPSTE